MVTTVTLDVFSGRPNPTFVLSEKEEDELNERLSGMNDATTLRPSGSFGGLGYRGMLLRRGRDDPKGPLDIRAHEAILDKGSASANVWDESGVEAWLRGLAADHVSRAILEHVTPRARDAGPTFLLPERGAGLSCPPCNAADAPAYNPGPWNAPAVQPYNNCYNYANDQITNTFAQPGRASGHPITAMACTQVQASATADGLVQHGNFTDPLAKGKGWYVALVIWPAEDYHWYRQDSGGCWSHKAGGTPATNLDNAGQPIADPQHCDRGPYTTFCCYMITNRGVVIN